MRGKVMSSWPLVSFGWSCADSVRDSMMIFMSAACRKCARRFLGEGIEQRPVDRRIGGAAIIHRIDDAAV